jgi:hypothetical protein
MAEKAHRVVSMLWWYMAAAEAWGIVAAPEAVANIVEAAVKATSRR